VPGPSEATLFVPGGPGNPNLVNRDLTPLEERQELLSHHVRLVARGMANGLFVYGACGGLGKSKVIQETLLAEGADLRLLNSHITALSLYETLYFSRSGKVIWLDDCDGLYGDLKILGLLRSALWGQNNQRTVTYTSSQLGELPNSFTFESRIIMTANVLPKKNNAFRAVLSRIDVFELSASNEEVVALMKTIAAKGFEDLSQDTCLEVVEFIEKHADGRQLSMRLLEPSFRKVQYAHQEGLDWQPLVKSQLQTLGKSSAAATGIDMKTHEVQCLRAAAERYPSSVREQQTHWSRATGKSRASFFRVLARHRTETGAG